MKRLGYWVYTQGHGVRSIDGYDGDCSLAPSIGLLTQQKIRMHPYSMQKRRDAWWMYDVIRISMRPKRRDGVSSHRSVTPIQSTSLEYALNDGGYIAMQSPNLLERRHNYHRIERILRYVMYELKE